MAISVSNNILWYVRDFQNIWQERDGRFSILSLDYETISNILSSVNLNVKNEYFVWKAIYDWIKFDKNSRLDYLPNLIKNCLRFGHLDKDFIDIYIFECELFLALPDAVQFGLKDFITNVLQNCKQTTADNFDLSYSSIAFYFSLRNQFLVCIEKLTLGSINYYDQLHNSWRSSSSRLQLPAIQYRYQLALLGSMLYAFGGKDDDCKTTNLVWSRDLSDPSSQWTARANMKQSRWWFASVVFNDTIYALGGGDTNNDPLRSCERYDSQLNEWSTVANMNWVRSSASAAVINGCIYIAGGKNKKNIFKSVCKYCPKTDTWNEVAPMTTERSHLTLTPFAGRLWAIGGTDGNRQPLRSCESYDPVTDTWQEEAPMKEGRWGHEAIEFNGELYVVDGRRRNEETKEMERTQIVEKYVPNIKKWVENSALQNYICYCQLLIIPPTCSSFFTTDPNQ